MPFLAEETMPCWPLGLYLAAVGAMVAGMVIVSHVLGGRHRERATGVPYESGMTPTGSARLRFDANFYLVVMFFVVFDVESAFLFAWAVAAKDPNVGWQGYGAAMVFMAVLLAALGYLWRVGALDWSAGARKRNHTHAAPPGSSK